MPVKSWLKGKWDKYGSYLTEAAIALPVALVFLLIAAAIDDPQTGLVVSQEILKLAIGADASMLGLVLAGLAVATAIARPDFIRWLKEKELYAGFRFPFWFTCMMWALHMVFAAVTFLATYVFVVTRTWFLLLVAVHGFFFSYALVLTIGLVIFIFKLAERQAEHERLAEKGRTPE